MERGRAEDKKSRREESTMGVDMGRFVHLVTGRRGVSSE
jgi:hypothetical protein